MKSQILITPAKAVFIVALLHPVIIGLLYNTGREGMYVDLIVVMYLGLGNVFCETIIGLFIWLFFEKPIDIF